jgi:VanZ family protein
MIKFLFSAMAFKVYLLVTLLVIEFLATTTIHIEVIESVWDKANHFTAFFVLYVLLTFSYRNMSIYMKSFLLLAFGLQIEIVQSFIDGRFFSLLDVFADSVGIILGILFIKLIAKKFNTLF